MPPSKNPTFRHGCLCFMNVLCCQVEVSATGRSPFQVSLTLCVCVCLIYLLSMLHYFAVTLHTVIYILVSFAGDAVTSIMAPDIAFP